ncbi:hypothetical protein ACRFPP_18260 [Klebsiella michiganensis]|uniref:hypothetical protein n=1 Tax=Klebsiella michiganensis TaxID=1134687 RepID=UPI003D6CBC9B
MTTDITELTPETARESGSILIIVAARMARREFFTPLHALCESGKRVVSTRALCDAVERAEEHMVSQVSKIVDGHDRLTKKLKEAESRNAELVEELEKAQRANAAQDDHISQRQDSIEKLEEGHQQAAKRIHSWRRLAKLSIAEQEKCVNELDTARQRIAELESRTVKLPNGWQFEECEIEGCENGAIFSVGTGSRNIHLCDKCTHESQNSRLKKSPLPKRLPFKMSAGIKWEAE